MCSKISESINGFLKSLIIRLVILIYHGSEVFATIGLPVDELIVRPNFWICQLPCWLVYSRFSTSILPLIEWPVCRRKKIHCMFDRWFGSLRDWRVDRSNGSIEWWVKWQIDALIDLAIVPSSDDSPRLLFKFSVHIKFGMYLFRMEEFGTWLRGYRLRKINDEFCLRTMLKVLDSFCCCYLMYRDAVSCKKKTL